MKEEVKQDREVETLKCDLAICPDFNLMEAFRTFDIKDRGALTIHQFEHGLNRYGIFLIGNELELLMNKFDQDLDGIINYADFVSGILPADQHYAKTMRSHGPNIPLDTNEGEFPFSSATRRKFVEMLKQMISAEDHSEIIRERLASRKDFSIYEAFKTIDKNDLGQITVPELETIFEENGVFLTHKDMEMLVARYDTDHDGRISFSDFYSEIAPKVAPEPKMQTRKDELRAGEGRERS